jgi:hypothetical protein
MSRDPGPGTAHAMRGPRPGGRRGYSISIAAAQNEAVVVSRACLFPDPSMIHGFSFHLWLLSSPSTLTMATYCVLPGGHGDRRPCINRLSILRSHLTQYSI